MYYRSQRPDSSWITCAVPCSTPPVCSVSVLDIPDSPRAEVTVRAGFLALRAIAGFFRVPSTPTRRRTTRSRSIARS
ncbi:MAG: hypothetical protein R2726_20600 [Acidimicrobiales bacterium]